MKKLAAVTLFSCIAFIGAAPVFSAGTVAAPTTPAPPPVAARILDLFDRLRAAEEHKGDADSNVSFKLNADEVNDYMRYALKTTPRPGLESVSVKFFPKDYVSTFTKVDFDAVEQWKPGTIPTLLRPFLKGKKTILIDFRVKAVNSNLTYTVEKARYDDMILPAFFVEKMIQIVAARQPEKYDTSKPIPLPFGLNAITTGEKFVTGHN
jgi:hypothetical protein